MERSTVAGCFGVIAVVTLVGNSLVVAIFVKKRQWLNKVHTCLLLALAIQDILTAVCLLVVPNFLLDFDAYTLPSHPTPRKLFCKLFWSTYIPFALSNASIYTCLMLAIDRWLAVFRPMAYKRYHTSRKIIATMLIFPVVAGFAFEIGTALNVETVERDNESYACVMREYHSSPGNIAAAFFLFSGKGFLPAILMVIAYVNVVIRLKRTSSRVARAEPTGLNSSVVSNGRRNEGYSSLKKITGLVFAASAIVMVCWLPDQLYFCLYELGFIAMDVSTHNGLHILAFLNMCFNPFVYGFCNTQYREELRMILCCFIKKKESSRLPDSVINNDHELGKVSRQT